MAERIGPASKPALGGSSNGRTADSDSASLGSNPSPPANTKPCTSQGFFVHGPKQTTETPELGRDHYGQGRLTRETLQRVLPRTDCES